MIRHSMDLTFDFVRGSCNTFTKPTEKTLLCFEADNPTACHRLVKLSMISSPK